MASRRGQRSDLNKIFDANGPNAGYSLEETDASIFGNLAEIDVGRQVAKPVSIFEIAPDPAQPRRALPTPVRLVWDGRPDTTPEMFAHWYELAIKELGQEFAVEPYLLAREEAPRPKKIGPLQAALLDLLELAGNIRNNGLTNPITIGRRPSGYLLETGERRWLAYHMLHVSFPDERKSWEKIPARVLEEGVSVWRQASENNARANLNAISRARQLAILIIHLLKEQGYQFQPYEVLTAAGGCDRPYYAQVADGEKFPIPKGQVETVMNASGFKSESQVREYRQLLRLPDVVWQIADDLNWTQGRIRSMYRYALGSDKALVALALERADEENYRVGIPTPDVMPPPFKHEAKEDLPLLTHSDRQLLRQVQKLARQASDPKFRATPRDLREISEMREWLEKLERQIKAQIRGTNS